MLADELVKVGSPGEAISELREAIRIDPLDPALHAQLARLYERSHLATEAILEYEEVIRLDPANSAAVRTHLEQVRAKRSRPGP